MTLFPFFENIENKTFLVIGGGKVAAGKIKRLSAFTKNIIVIAEKTDITGFKVINKCFEDDDIFLGDYVIGATDSRELNGKIANLCKQNKIPVNIVDDPENCTFIFPSLIKKGDLTIGITSAGKSPAFSRHVRREIEQILPDDTERILDTMHEIRERLKSEIPCQKTRSIVNKKVLAVLLERGDISQGEIERIIIASKENTHE
ncbi:MAG: bifunctional precorrin-2 dehydrogenase/sirohydrochlorin ferrochelatase [Faecalibacterium sp.]|nr:bifunctional precorrin-2 dehydrogenase/sirohydrochlorin ferrochelatase [Ruminococcus sp.]MCM1392967.1 bifunctional precorrin-2 dehydrogenase/sirohydrochlorin ferrochelatase [Ruminococcus sp.]MCM1486579.1 bifunctional precorrin-2 dehydrogenase/sirohydrochlorin ferrochelatase [Faecalibacterium sp.]